MIFTRDFRMMAQEGHLASTALLGSFEKIAGIDYDAPGTVYSALFQLSTGLERMMKIAVVLDHKAKHDLANPSDAQLRKLGHSITDLYEFLRAIGETRGIVAGWFPNGTVQSAVLAALAEFARSSRYYNLDQLVGGRDDPDPLTRWFDVHWQIATRALGTDRLESIMERARKFCEHHGRLGWEQGPRGGWEMSIDVVYQIEVARQTCGHCVWAIIEVLQPIYRLISELVDEVHRLDQLKGHETPSAPYMTEFFVFCGADRATAIRRKAWTKLFRFAGRV